MDFANQYGPDIDTIAANINNPRADHSNIQSYILHLNIGFIIVVCLVIALRTFVRTMVIKHLLIEDHLMILAGACAIAFFAMNILGLSYGFGDHIWDIPLTEILSKVKKAVQTLFICQILYSTSLILVKLSIVSTFWRIFPQLWMRNTLFGLGSVMLAVWVVTTFTTIFQCRPVAGAWDFTLEKKCLHIKNVFYFSTSFSALTDVILCILPLPLFWGLKLPNKEKWVVSALFMFGLFAAVASILRCISLKYLDNADVTMKSMPALNWSVGELSTGIVCACIPPLKPLFTKLFPGKFFSSVQSRTHRTQDHPYRPKISGPIQKIAYLPKGATWRKRDDPWDPSASRSDEIHVVHDLELSSVSKSP